MIDEFITKVGAALQGWFSSIFSLSFVPEIFFWYWWLFVVAVVCGVIIFFFGWSKIVRIVASMAFLFSAIFAAGGWYMEHRMKKREAMKPKPKPKPELPTDDQARWNPFGKW